MFFFQNESVQVAFMSKEVKKFWAEKAGDGEQKFSVFSIFFDDINGDIDKIETNNLTINV